MSTVTFLFPTTMASFKPELLSLRERQYRLQPLLDSIPFSRMSDLEDK